MRVKTRNDGLGNPNSWEARLSGIDSTRLSESSVVFIAWGSTEGEALENLDVQIERVVPRLQTYLAIT